MNFFNSSLNSLPDMLSMFDTLDKYDSSKIFKIGCKVLREDWNLNFLTKNFMVEWKALLW